MRESARKSKKLAKAKKQIFGQKENQGEERKKNS